jgi:hypothetical protein
MFSKFQFLLFYHIIMLTNFYIHSFFNNFNILFITNKLRVIFHYRTRTINFTMNQIYFISRHFEKCEIDTINNKQQCCCDKTLFDGELCEINVLKTCNSTYMCLNGGTCMDNGKCLCAPGYTSSRCQVKSLPNQCGDKLCLNDATVGSV